MTTPPITCPEDLKEQLRNEALSRLDVVSTQGNRQAFDSVFDDFWHKIEQHFAQPIATVGEPKGNALTPERVEAACNAILVMSPEQLKTALEQAEIAVYGKSSPSPASTDPHAGSNISARCVRGEHTECEFGVLCDCECHKETRQDSEDSWNAVAASGEREEIQPTAVDREVLGKVVRAVWIKWAKQQPNCKASWLVEWEALSEPDKEVDRLIGESLVGFTDSRLRLAVEDLSQELSDHQLARAQDKARIAGLERWLSDARQWIDQVGFRFAGTEHHNVSTGALTTLSRTNPAAELNRNTEE